MYIVVVHSENEPDKTPNVAKLLTMFPGSHMFPVINPNEIKFIPSKNRVHSSTPDQILKKNNDNQYSTGPILFFIYYDQLYRYCPTGNKFYCKEIIYFLDR